jgi:hypothetical protein
MDARSFQTVEDARLQISQTLEKSIQSTGARRFSTPKRHLTDMNMKAAEKASRGEAGATEGKGGGGRRKDRKGAGGGGGDDAETKW